MATLASNLCRFAGLGGAVAALLAAGCASSDLASDSKTMGGVVECLPPGTPAPLQVARAIWFPYSSGFRSADSSPEVHVTGVLVLAGSKLWFMAWNDPERHFDMVHLIDFQAAEKVRVDHFGTSAMLVIQSGNDSYDSFELMGGGQFASDPKATQELFEKLKALRSNPPQPDP